MTFVNLHVHSHFSLLDGLSKPVQIAERCAALSQPACAITDHGSISGAADFMAQCKTVGIKPIIGCEMYVANDASIKERDSVAHQIILAKNLKGWYKLIELVSKSNDKENFYYKPRIDVAMMRDICDDNMISFTGHLGSTLAEIIDDPVQAEAYVGLMKDIFGPDNFFIEVQLIDCVSSPEMITHADKLRALAKRTKTRCVATGDAHYPTKEAAADHAVLLCSSLQLTLPDVRQKLQKGHNVPLGGFFKTQQYYVPSLQDFQIVGNTPEELDNTLLVSDMCQAYDITGPPRLPHFACPGNQNEIDYLRQLCRNGWRAKNQNWDGVYSDRVKYELSVIEQANLAGYFLIVQDYVNWAKSQGWLVGPGRGSGAGCLVSYLLNITSIDPIKHGLLFERFYNPGRNTAERISLPDIDADFPIMKRKQVIDYVKVKYGKEHVCQIATFGRMQGRGAISEVLRIHGTCDFEDIKRITKELPEEASISDQLEESGETSIIRWTLENEPKQLADWCVMNDDESLSGEYATYFEQAIRLEGTYKSQGKHPAGVVISADQLDKVCPMINDKNNDEKIAGMNMVDMELMGHTKFDILGVAVLDKLMGVNNLLRTGRVEG